MRRTAIFSKNKTILYSYNIITGWFKNGFLKQMTCADSVIHCGPEFRTEGERIYNIQTNVYVITYAYVPRTRCLTNAVRLHSEIAAQKLPRVLHATVAVKYRRRRRTIKITKKKEKRKAY